jgi:DNA-binding LacI/PurR family transcriptional regulator
MLLVDIFAPQTNFPSSDFIQGIHDRLGEDVQLVIASSNRDWQQEARQLQKLAGEVDGLLLWPTASPQNTPLIRQLVDDGFPIVILDRVPEGVCSNSVVSENEAVTLHAIRLLEARGHRQIGFFSFDKPGFSSVSERHSAYKKALAEVGISDPTQYTRWFLNEFNDRPQHFYQAVRDALFTLTHQPERITALFCVQDSLAALAIQACEELGISIPENLELVTFNDWPPLMLRIPWCVHRIVQRSYEIGSLAADLLLNQIADPARPPEARRVPVDFYVADAGLSPATLLATDTNGG